MDSNGNKERTARRHRDSAIAAGVTMIVALLLLLLLYFGHIDYSARDMAGMSMPEPGVEEELFLDPELLDLGEDNSEHEQSAAPAAQGAPEVAEEVTNQVTVPGNNDKPAPPKEKLVTGSQTSPVKSAEPKAKEEERRQVKDLTGGAFSPDNGKNDGVNGAAGSGGTGIGVSGYAEGREFISCPKPTVSLRNKTVVKVRVTVDASGNVTAATALSGGTAELQRKCERAAMGARWKAKAGAAPVRGTITFTLVPK